MPIIPKSKDEEARTGTWVEMASYWCPITGVPTKEIFKELFSYGLTQIEIKNLEYLCDPKVLARLGTTKIDYNNKTNLISYLRAWSDQLTEEGSGDKVETKPLAEEQLVTAEVLPKSFLERLFS